MGPTPANADEARTKAMSTDSNPSSFHRLQEVMVTAGNRTMAPRDAKRAGHLRKRAGHQGGRVRHWHRRGVAQYLCRIDPQGDPGMVPFDERARSPQSASLGCRLHVRRTTGRLVQPCRPTCPQRHVDARAYRHVAGGLAGRTPTGSRAAHRDQLGKLTAQQRHALAAAVRIGEEHGLLECGPALGPPSDQATRGVHATPASVERQSV
jgi:hypothetical protein